MCIRDRDDIVFDRKVMVHLSRMVAPIIIYLFVPLAFVEVGSSAMDFIRRICLIYIIITFLSFVNSFLKAVYSVYSEKEQFRDRPLKGMLQTMQVILWPVSYTHLDVYKRQTIQCAYAPEYASHSAGGIIVIK